MHPETDYPFSIGSPSEAVHAHFQQYPYPSSALDAKVLRNPADFYRHNLITPFYLRDRALPPPNLNILDVGCGTGAKTLAIAKANPQSSILGVDFSGTAIDLARRRTALNSVPNVSFLELPLDQVFSIGQRFDYINCDECLYLLSDPQAGLNALRSCLSDNGIIRANIHNLYQRQAYLRANKLLRILGIADSERAPRETKHFYSLLHSNTTIKKTTWRRPFQYAGIASNHLLTGDKGLSLEATFGMISNADLELLGMVDYHRWDIQQLFDPHKDDTPGFIDRIRAMPLTQALLCVELIHYSERLFDFWCYRKPKRQPPARFQDLDATRQAQTKICLHPALQNATFLTAVHQSIRSAQALDVCSFVPYLGHAWLTEQSLYLAALVGLNTLTVGDLYHDWRLLRSYDPIHRRNRPDADILHELMRDIHSLEAVGILLTLVGVTQTHS